MNDSKSVILDNIDKDILGVSTITSAFARMGWTLRERGRIDYGIDADVEVKESSEFQNKHFALQIKSGNSFLKEKKNGLISFSLDAWHYKYWLKSDRPVLILFYDIDRDCVIWEYVSLSRLQKIKKKHLIEISPLKKLTIQSKEELEDIISNYKPFENQRVQDECVNFEYSIFAYRQINNILKDINSDFTRFREEFNEQAKSLNILMLIHLIDTFNKQISSNQDLVYENYSKSHWYLNEMTENIPNAEKPILEETINKNKQIVDDHIRIWSENVEGYSKLIHPNIPNDLQRATKKLVFRLKEYVAILNAIRDIQNAIISKIS